MVYVALLRGINVGGNNKIDMKQLRITFERVGMTSVVTYINTGNIIFGSDLPTVAAISTKLEEVIEEDFGLSIRVITLSLDKMRSIMRKIPESWTNDQTMKSDIMFLWNELDHNSVLDRLVIKPEIDTVIYTPGAVLWSVDRDNVTRSGMMKLAGSKEYQYMTVRNVNTTRKIYELMINMNGE